MSAIRKTYIDLPDDQLHAHVLGEASGGRPIVYLQQTASSGKMFYQIMPKIGADRFSVAFDTPGFGGSFDPQGMPSLPDYARWIAQAIAALGLTEVDIVAHHTGVCIAAELAVHYDCVRSVAMMGPPVLTAEEREEFRAYYARPMAPTVDGAYLLETWNYLAKLGADSDLDLHHREVLDTARAWYGRFQAYSAVWDQDFSGLFMQITQPIAILCAPDDVLMPYFERARDMRPDAHSYVLQGANFEPDQDVEGCAVAILDFWRKIS